MILLSCHSPAVFGIVLLCPSSLTGARFCLSISISETKEMIIIFCKNTLEISPVLINDLAGEVVSIVKDYILNVCPI